MRYITLAMPTDGLSSQLRRGVLEHCVLAVLEQEPRYGFELVQLLRDVDGLLTSEGTIYPLLSRMRGDGLVKTEWRESSEGPPRRYYGLTPAGRDALRDFRGQWARFRNSVDRVLHSPKGGTQ
jgi:PadR family transcriptional regulator PadR